MSNADAIFIVAVACVGVVVLLLISDFFLRRAFKSRITNCSACAYSVPINYTPERMVCRRSTPVVMGGDITVWPIVEPGDWCGEGERR